MIIRNRIVRHGLVGGSYILLTVLSLALSYLLRFEFQPSAEDWRNLLLLLPFILLVRLSVLVWMGQFESLLTFFSVPDLLRIMRAASVTTVIFIVVWYGSGGKYAPPRSIVVMDGIFFTGMACGFRLWLRNLRDGKESGVNHTKRHWEPVAIIGAGDAGAQLAQQLMRNPKFGLKPLVFLDDDRAKWGHLIHGIRIAGGPEWLLGTKVPVMLHRVVIAMPSAPRKRIQAIIEMLEGRGLRLDTVLSINELVDSKTSLTQLRPIQIDDLLGRDPAELDAEGIRRMIKGRVVAVTGAGGSIGSELCRQILRCEPEKLLLIDQSEGLLFIIEQELVEAGFKHLMVPLVADICDAERLAGIFAEHRPVSLFHAAAHKHVPMMESQPVEAIKNNVLGTMRLARAAAASGVKSFVLISTDKAINPTNVMGATKRMAEIFLQAFGAETGGTTRFISVRFGNVLGSSGSVVPIFQKQIAAGGPVKVTHPEITRYFMTIPEAVGLVLQSSLLGQGGEIFLLDMGKPVKIVDLAKTMILLQGLKPEEDISIEYTGLRPGEKMYEELSYDGETMQTTQHPKIYKLTTVADGLEEVSAEIARLEAGMARMTADELKRQMTRLVPEYTPSLRDQRPPVAPPQQLTPA